MPLTRPGRKPSVLPMLVGWLAVAGSAAAVAILAAFPGTAVFAPPILPGALNIVFLTAVSILVMVLAVHGFLASRSLPVLLLGSGSLALGLGAALAAIPLEGRGSNWIASIYNTSAALSAVCSLAAAAFSYRPYPIRSRRAGPALWIAYLGVVAVVATIAAATLLRLVPVFFVEGSGATAWDKGVLFAAAGMFVLASGLLWSLRADSQFHRWYAVGLAMIAVGLVGVSFQHRMGSALNWTGRSSQYVGSVFLLVAVLSTAKETGRPRISLERTLREREGLYSTLVDLSPDAIMVHDGRRYLFANAAAARLFGAGSPRKLVGREVLALVAPEARDLVRGRVAQAPAGAVVPPRELRMLRLDGRPVDVEATSTRVQYGGRPAVQLVLRDIAAQRQAALIDLAHDAIIVRDEADRIELWNRGAEQTYGWNREEALGRVAHELLRTVFPQAFEVIRGRTLSTGRWEGELRHRRRDGTEIVVASRWAVRREADGSDHILEVNRDVTERARAEERIREAFRYARGLLEASLDPLVTISREGTITDVNRATEEATGFPRDRLVGTSFSGYFTEPEQAERGYRTVLAEGSVRDYPLTVRHASGRTMEVLYNATVYRGENGEVLGVFAAARDVTELQAHRRHLESLVRERTAELARIVAELARSNADLEQFASVASHDLKEPLRMVTGFLGLLESGALDEKSRGYIRFAVDGGRRMQAMIDDLLTYSRAGRGEAVETVDLERVLEEVRGSLAVSLEESGAMLTHDPLPKLTAGSVEVSQLLQNLLSNAVKFRGDRRPEIHVGARRADGPWVISVRDNGIGIDARDAERIFMIFQRLHTRDEYPGTGIGLAICKKIVERRGGRIWVESEPGRGSTFFFTLPEAG